MNKKLSVLILTIILLFTSVPAFAIDIPGTSDNTNTPYSIVSPQVNSDGIVYSDNLLISIKAEANTSLLITTYNYPGYNGTDSFANVPATALTVKKMVGEEEKYAKSEKVGLYSKQLKDIKPGLYSIKVDVLDDEGQETSSYSKYFLVKSNADKVEPTIYQSQPSSKVLFFQSVFRSLFG